MKKENGNGRVTMKMIADRARVSVSAVSLALRNDPQIAEGTRLRIIRTAREMGYMKNPVIAQLMSELRSSRSAGHRRTIALLNAHPRVAQLADHFTLPYVAEGCRRRAEASGYRCEEFWLNDPLLGPRELNRSLAERGIRGVIVVGVRENADVLTRYATTWATHACVAVGARPASVDLSYCSTDFFALGRESFRKAVQFGYSRTALVVDEVADRPAGNMLIAGMEVGQQALPEGNRVPPFRGYTAAKKDPALFAQWLGRAKPDAIVTFHRRDVCRWLEDLGMRVPDDIGLVVLDRQKNSEGWACMDQRGDVLGEVAVDLLTTALNHHEIGLPAVQRAVTISPVWVAGDSVVDRAAGTAARSAIV